MPSGVSLFHCCSFARKHALKMGTNLIYSHTKVQWVHIKNGHKPQMSTHENAISAYWKWGHPLNVHTWQYNWRTMKMDVNLHKCAISSNWNRSQSSNEHMQKYNKSILFPLGFLSLTKVYSHFWHHLLTVSALPLREPVKKTKECPHLQRINMGSTAAKKTRPDTRLP